MQGVIAGMKLQDARARLRISQVKLAERANVAPGTVVSAENGRSIQLASAYAILDALNAFRKEKGFEPLKLNDLEWNISQ